MAITVRQVPASLTWGNFREVDTLPDPGDNEEQAQIRPETDFPQDMPIERVGGTLRLGDFILPVILIADRTAVIRTAGKTAELLRHEQGHHDLYFLAVRAMARDLEAIRASGPDDLSSQMLEKRNRHHARATAIDSVYDDETEHGNDQEAQARWDEAVRAAKRAPRPTQLFSHPL